MKRIDKDGKKRKLNIEFIHKKDGTKLEEILKGGIFMLFKKFKGQMICFFEVLMVTWHREVMVLHNLGLEEFNNAI